MFRLEKEKSLCSLVYGFLVIRIRTGYYQPGDQILSKPISDLFEISNITVRNALRLLEQEGYVSLSKNQRATVIWDSSHIDSEIPPKQFLIDQETIRDVNQSYAILQTEILRQGLRLFTPSELEELENAPGQSHPVSVDPIMYLIKKITGRFGNPLLLDLYLYIVLYTYPTTLEYLQNGSNYDEAYLSKLYQSYLKAIELCKRQEYDQLDKLVQEMYVIFRQSPVYTEQKKVDASVHSYRWWKMPVGPSVCNQLLIQMRSGVYPVNSFLPSTDALAKEFSVSKMTIRRTLWMLNSLGVAKTINGVGTKVIPLEEGVKNIKWDSPDIQKNMLLCLYSLQILLITCRRVTNSVFGLIPKKEQIKMAEELEAGMSVQLFHIAYGIWMKRIIRYSSLTGIREIYVHLMGLLTWGIPLRFCREYVTFPDLIQSMADCLKNGNGEKFVDELERFCYLSFLHSKEVMIQQGINDAEKVVVPLMDISLPGRKD